TCTPVPAGSPVAIRIQPKFEPGLFTHACTSDVKSGESNVETPLPRGAEALVVEMKSVPARAPPAAHATDVRRLFQVASDSLQLESMRFRLNLMLVGCTLTVSTREASLIIASVGKTDKSNRNRA